MKQVWVLGAGNFGLKAVGRLERLYPAAKVTAVDQKSDIAGLGAADGQVTYFRGDAVEFLEKELKQKGGPDWIVPAVPFHVACKWIKRRLSSLGPVTDMELPLELVDLLPNTLQGKNGELYSSIADFKCPDNCNEPSGRCRVTKKERPFLMYERLASIDLKPFRSVVVKSRQLCPGAGGYKPADLFRALEAVQQYRGPVLLSTACKCHAVLNAFQ